MSKSVVIIGGGTVAHIRPHLAISAPAYGQTVDDIAETIKYFMDEDEWEVIQYLTRMANGDQRSDGTHILKTLETNEDVSLLVDKLVADPRVKVVFMPVALCDFDVRSIITETPMGVSREECGKRLPRLKSAKYRDEMTTLSLALKPAEKIIGKVRKTRKDIFLVGFKTTTGATEQEQFEAGLSLMKESSCNLVLANDLVTRLNMVVTPEQAKYGVTKDRFKAIEELVKITASRAMGTFTRSTVIDGQIVPWNSPEIPDNLRTVVNHCANRGAYRPFQGKTVGHFAAKIGDGRFLTSIRKTNFNDLLVDPERNGLVKVEAVGDDKVIAYGAKPSVGGQSQRAIFLQHPETDGIVHFHCQLKPGSQVPIVEQWKNECGSKACGDATACNLKDFGGIKAVFLEKHGPNVVFSKDVDPQKVIEFIEANFDLDHQTSELS